MSLRDFGWNELIFLLLSARWTLLLSLIAFAGGGFLGLIVAACRIAPSRVLQRIAIVWIRILQGTPLLVQLLIVYYGSSFIGFRPDAWAAAAIGFTANSSAFFGEIWRGCLQAIPAGQWDGARALGLRFPGTLRLVVLPQALRLMIGPTIGYMVQIVKSTSVASLIGIVELTRTAVVVNTVTFEPVRVFGTVALTYFALCWPLSLLAERATRRLDRRQSSGIGDLLRRRVARATPVRQITGMRPIRTAAMIALPILVGAGAARADDEKPVLVPQRDVVLIYSEVVTRPGQLGTPKQVVQFVRGQTGSNRAEISGGAYSIITDFEKGHTFVLINNKHTYTEVIPNSILFRPDIFQKSYLAVLWTRTGEETVSGVACTTWHGELGPTIIDQCRTADGIGLRQRVTIPSGAVTERTVTAVRPTPIDPALLQVPSDYTANPIARTVAEALQREGVTP